MKILRIDSVPKRSLIIAFEGKQQFLLYVSGDLWGHNLTTGFPKIACSI